MIRAVSADGVALSRLSSPRLWDPGTDIGFFSGVVFRSFKEYTGTDWAVLSGTKNDNQNLWELAIGNTGSFGADNKGFCFFKRAGANIPVDENSIMADGHWHSFIGGRRSPGDGKAFCCLDGGPILVSGGAHGGNIQGPPAPISFGDRNADTKPFFGDITNMFYFQGTYPGGSAIRTLGKMMLSGAIKQRDLGLDFEVLYTRPPRDSSGKSRHGSLKGGARIYVPDSPPYGPTIKVYGTRLLEINIEADVEAPAPPTPQFVQTMDFLGVGPS